MSDRLLRALLPAALGAALAVPVRADESVFVTPELTVTASPAIASHWALPADEKVIDFDIWPDRPVAVALVRGADGAVGVREWTIGTTTAKLLVALPGDVKPASLTVHPLGRKVFLTARRGEESVILSAAEQEGWQWKTLRQGKRELRRLLVAPRPFVTGYEAATNQPILRYRIVFGERLENGSYSTRSITEEGDRDYQVVGPASDYTAMPDVDMEPTRNEAASALPSAFHPAGHILLWQDPHGCFQQLPYDSMNWGSPRPVAGKPCGGSVTVTPNGLGLLHWKKGTPGVTLITGHGQVKSSVAATQTFTGTPSSVADGKGLVGLVDQGGTTAMHYVPISVPLADVVNAWMFVEDPTDEKQLTANNGLFRPLDHEQLYQLYESENYACGGYEASIPTRPYFITTDVFLELVGAAYEGIFVMHEHQAAVPAFWTFVDAAAADLATRQPDSPWAKAFAAVAALRQDGTRNAETQRIRAANARAPSDALESDFNFAELTPRGHYTGSPEMETYFKGVRYLTRMAALRTDSAVLSSASAEVKTRALRWTDAYRAFIAPGRAPLAWSAGSRALPAYARHPLTQPQVFPLSWGYDNEILLSTVYHPDWPEAEQIKGKDGPRLLPSGLDLAAAFGSERARELLREDLGRYPALGPVLDSVGRRAPTAGAGDSLYDAWMLLLGRQWRTADLPGAAELDRTFWQTKRLQTGLASWATLRHATALVNELVAAECGEGGFEAIVLRPPRGYVEPDPEFFATAARLFEQIDRAVAALESAPGGKPLEVSDNGVFSGVNEGVSRRLKATAEQARLFEAIARKELKGEPLTDAEYEAILYIARIAEHHLLIFKSLNNKDLALSNPEPMMKIAEVAGEGPWLMAAVGRPLEWDQVVPFYGRREIVKGSVYSYYEFPSDTVMTDAQWRDRVDQATRPAWISRHLSSKGLSCPAVAPF
ncbi:DUF3160 domain-containing protein [Tahibacter amnicola]|uniref:DUF3160 domain-containing protein n=1 Tax=Tahibacter amnicola TaxID=2976241 RepID=A0ABY6BAD3_9GAMM|nr:DUF3160 domain-containing protein [Tahibacter amnicola]UXI66502.1 DUF3160 domain-containing protein [Tahibacter amnicola]